MAGKSKSSKNKENSNNGEDIDASDSGLEAPTSDAESSAEEPIVIEGEAVELDANAEDFPAENEIEATAEPEAVEDGTQEIADDTVDLDEPALEVEEPATETPPQAEQQSSGGGTSVVALVFGGIIAGAIGYFGSTLAPKPEAPGFDDTELSAGVAANTAALVDLRGTVADLGSASAPEVDLSGIESQLQDITQSLSTMTDDLTSLQGGLAEATQAFEAQAVELEERIVALETAVPAAGELATDDELSALRTRIEEMMGNAEARLAEAQAEAEALTQEAAEMRAVAEAEALEVTAAAEAREAELQAKAERQSALVDLKSAVEAGASFADTLPALGAVPEVLAANAETGLATLASLQESFPTMARAALSQSVTLAEDASTGERLTAFLKRRTNARSLTEQEGDGPDALLSRAEARLGEGNLAAAVAELDGLPEEGKAALADWLEQAQTRLSAISAIDELTATN